MRRRGRAAPGQFIPQKPAKLGVRSMFPRSFLPSFRAKSKSRPRDRKTPSRQLHLENLEARVVMAASVSLTDGVLRAVSDNAATNITLSHAGTTTTLNGKAFADASFSRIEILGGAGNDVIRVLDTPAGKTVAVKAGGGADTIHVGNAGN